MNVCTVSTLKNRCWYSYKRDIVQCTVWKYAENKIIKQGKFETYRLCFMNTTKYTYKQKVKTFSDSQLFGLEMTPYLNIQYPEWERGEEGSWGKNSLVKCCTHGIILLHFSPLYPNTGEGGLQEEWQWGKKSELVFLDHEKWELVFLKKTQILSYF